METEELQEESPLTGEQKSRRKDPWKSRRKVQQKSCGKDHRKSYRKVQQRSGSRVPRGSCRKAHQIALQQPAGMKRRSDGEQILKTQEKTEAAKKLQLPGHQEPAEELQEGPGDLSGHMEGPGGGGAPRPGRARRGTREELA